MVVWMEYKLMDDRPGHAVVPVMLPEAVMARQALGVLHWTRGHVEGASWMSPYDGMSIGAQ